MGVLDAIDTNIANVVENRKLHDETGQRLVVTPRKRGFKGGIENVFQDKKHMMKQIVKGNEESGGLYYNVYKKSTLKGNNVYKDFIEQNQRRSPTYFRNDKSDNDEEKNLVDDEIISTEQSKTEETVTLADVVRRREEADLYVVNIDSDLTLTIKETFEKHGCQVSVSKLEDQLIALYVMLNRRICIKKLRKLMEKGKKFGLDFCITKTGMTTILTNRLKNLFKV